MRFIILGDLHYSDYPDSEHAAARDRIFTHFFQQVGSLKPDFVFAVGDTTNMGTKTEMEGLEGIAQSCNLPFVRTTGNHDCYTLTKSEIATYFLGGRSSVSDVDLYTSFDTGSVRFVLKDTARELDHEKYDGFISDAQLAWLGEQIVEFNASSQLKYIVTLGHHPIHGTTRRSDESMLNIANSEVVSTVYGNLQRKGGFYFCGHNHNHSIYEQESQGWHHIQTANPLDCKSYRLVTMTSDQVEIKTLDFDLSDSTIQSDLEVTRHNIPTGYTPQPFENVYGVAGDHNLLIQNSAIAM